MSADEPQGGVPGPVDPAADEPLEGEIVEEGHDQAFAPGGAGAAGPAGPAPYGAPVTFTDATTSGGAGGAHGRAVAHRDRNALTLGAVLVTVGAVLLAYRFSDTLAAGSAPLVIGLGFLVWWAVSGTFGLVVPGGVLSGIGVGMILEQAGFSGDGVPLGLGLGFLAIYVLDAVRRRQWSRWWPLVPGVVLVVVGLFGNTSVWDSLGTYGWPLILIVAGVVVLAVGLSRRGTRR